MEGASIEKALGRIEAAVTRIEKAGVRAPDADHASKDLAARHQRLREAVAQSLRQLDGLLAGREP